MGHADNPDFHPHAMAVGTDGRLVEDDIVVGGMGALAVTVQVGTHHGDGVCTALAAIFVIQQRSVIVHQLLEAPVELVVAQGHGVVVHHVESHVKGFPALDV